MNASQIEELRKIVKQADELNVKITQLERGIEEGKRCYDVRIVFSPRFMIYVRRETDRDLNEVCWSSMMFEHSGEIRQAILGVFERKLQTLKTELDALDVKPSISSSTGERETSGDLVSSSVG